jgi:hypothetical protein
MSNRRSRWKYWVVALVAVVIAAATRFVYWKFVYVPAQHRKGVASKSLCMGKIAAITQAISDCWVRNRAFPPAYVAGEDGRPMHSWRVLILPFLDEQILYDQYDFSEPWDSPKNLEVWKARRGRETAPFACPADQESNENGRTSYVAVIGKNTLWPGTRGPDLNQLRDAGDKILFIEIPHSDIRWTEPRDVTLEEALELFQREKGGLRDSRHPRGLHYVTFGGQRSSFSDIESVEQFAEMLQLDRREDERRR